MIRVGVTGAGGFIGSHLVDRLKRDVSVLVVPFEKRHFEEKEELKMFVSSCDVIVHLAGMNRGDDSVIYKVNVDLVSALINAMEQAGAAPHIVFSSSTQSRFANAYGLSKKTGCNIFASWAKKSKSRLSILTIPNVFGDGCRPFYNSVVATFCYQLTHGEEPQIKINKSLELIHINDLTEKIYQVIKNPPAGTQKIRVRGTAKPMVSDVLAKLIRFKDSYVLKKIIPFLDTPFEVNLFNVFLSYLDYEDLRHVPEMRSDQRGDLFEVIKFAKSGQVFFSKTKPGYIRGNHYHTRKIERFCVLAGEAVVRLRRIGTDKVMEFKIANSQPAFVEIPVFHTHHIENVGGSELHTLFWSNELFERDDPDTYFEEVLIK